MRTPQAVGVITRSGCAPRGVLVEPRPADLAVMKEWGDVAGGAQVLVNGTVTTVHQGPGDLPMDHPWATTCPWM